MPGGCCWFCLFCFVSFLGVFLHLHLLGMCSNQYNLKSLTGGDVI